MLTANECLDRAKNLKLQAGLPGNIGQREALMEIFRTWLELASFTDWQDRRHAEMMLRLRVH
jgi:hypothetical protein